MPSIIDESSPIPKYYQVFEALREEISCGKLQPGSKIPSERNLVRLFGVSRITVVKALDMLEQNALIERRQGLGNFVLPPQNLETESRPRVINFMIRSGMDHFPTKSIAGAAQVAAENEMFLQIFPIPQNQSLLNLNNNLSQTQTDGTILFIRQSGLLQLLKQHHKISQGPIVLIDRFIDNYDSDYVIFDDEKAGYQLTKHLIDKGYQRISFLPGIEVTTSSVIARMNGYKKALEESGKSYDENLIFIDYEPPENKLHSQGMAHSLEHLEKFMLLQQPDAMVVVNSWMLNSLTHDLMELKNHCLQKRLETPPNPSHKTFRDDSYDIGLAAICDHWQNITYDKLHAIAFQDGFDLGAVAMHLMIDRLDSPEKPHQHIVLPMPLHIFKK